GHRHRPRRRQHGGVRAGERRAARQVRQRPRRHVLGHRHAHDGGLRRRDARDAGGPRRGGLRGAPGHRPHRAPRRHPLQRLRRGVRPRPPRPLALPPLRGTAVRELPAEIAREMPWPRRRVEAEGVALSVVDAGPPGERALVLLHGNPAWSFLWRRLIGPLVEAGHRVVAPDLVRASAMRFGARRPLSPLARRAYAWPMKEKGGRVAAGRFVQMVPDGPEHPEAATLRAIEAGFPLLAHAPVHVLWADRDPVMPPRLAERWRASGLAVASVEHVAPEAGHFWQEDAPEPFLARISALSSAR